MTKVLVLHPPTANLASTLRSPTNHQSQLRGPLQAPPLEVDERLQPDIAIHGERDLGLAS
jgi:hypothetical protein